ncbi:MAG: hypothetical protein ACERKV_11700 [Clostridiaceae bacterium]
MTFYKKKVFIDFDGTIVDSIKSYCSVYNKEYKEKDNFIHAKHQKVMRYDLKDQCHLVSHQENIFSSKMYFDNLEFMDGAKETLEELNKIYDVVICSLGTLTNISYKSIWIKENIPFINNVILISNEVLESGIKTDKSVINMKDAIFLDDHPENLKGSNAEIKIRFGREFDWNKDWDGESCFNWYQVRKRLI